jgi:hypothetical protein
MTHPPGVRIGERDLVDLFGRLHRDGASPHQHQGLLQLHRSRPEAAGGRGLRQPAAGAAAMIALLGYNAMQIG